MLLIFSDEAWRDRPEAERTAMYQEYAAITASPGIVGGSQLQPPATATTVRVEGGKPVVTDGPFVETKEALGGYYLLEAETLDAAVRLAARIPAARMGGAVEIRPLVRR
jgi:hypothetical protein